MKFRKLISFFASVAMLGAFTSCIDNDDSSVAVFGVGIDSSLFNDNGVFKEVDMVSPNGSLYINGLTFARDVNTMYQSFTGFQPSMVINNEVTENYWPNEQWGVVDKSQSANNKYSFLVGYWNSMETTTDIPANPSCKVAPATKMNSFKPLYVFISNSTVTYTAMAKGLGTYSRKFEAGDVCKLLIYGVKNNVRTRPVEFVLGSCDSNGVFKGVDQWTAVDVKELGDVDYIYFQMTSTDTGEYGINTPTYFCYYGMQAEYN